MSSSKQTSIMSNIITFIGIVCFLLLQDASASVVSTGDFNKDFFVNWSPSHVNTSLDGTTRSLTLDKDSGNCWMMGSIDFERCLWFQFSWSKIKSFGPFFLHAGSGFLSNDKLLFGQFDMKIKLIPGNSAGTVVAFYVLKN